MRFRVPILILALASGYGLSAQNPVGKCVHDSKQASFNEWRATLNPAHGYAASTARRQRILARFKDLKLEMSRTKVEALMGRPDYEDVSRHATPLPHCDYLWAYRLSVSDPNYLSGADQGVFILFTDADKAYWIHPQAIAGLQEKGKLLE